MNDVNIFEFFKLANIDIQEAEKIDELADILAENGHVFSDNYINHLIDKKNKRELTTLINNDVIDIERVPVELVQTNILYTSVSKTNRFFERCIQECFVPDFEDMYEFTLDIAKLHYKDHFSKEDVKDDDQCLIGIDEDYDVRFIKEHYKPNEIDFISDKRFNFKNWIKFDILDEPEYREFIFKSIIYAQMFNFDSNTFNILIKKYGFGVIEEIQSICDKTENFDFYNIIERVDSSYDGVDLRDHIDEFMKYEFKDIKCIEYCLKDGGYYTSAINFESIKYYISLKGKESYEYQKEYNKILSGSKMSYLNAHFEENPKDKIDVYKKIIECYISMKHFIIIPHDYLMLDHVLERHNNTGLIKLEELISIQDAVEREDEVVNLIVNMTNKDEINEIYRNYRKFHYESFFVNISKLENRIKLAQHDIRLVEFWYNFKNN